MNKTKAINRKKVGRFCFIHLQIISNLPQLNMTAKVR